ncbi:hypothetical protein H0H93_000854, partial [Arthromyces matolae]
MSALVNARNRNAASPQLIPTGPGAQWRNGPSPQLLPTGPRSGTPQNRRPGTPVLNPPGWNDWRPAGSISGDDCNPAEVADDEHNVEGGGPDVYIERRCFITITNGLMSSALHWKGHQPNEGHFVTAPPGIIPLGDTGSFEMDRNWGFFGSGGVAYYTMDMGNTLFNFQFGCPMVGDNYASASPDKGNPKVR